MNKTWCFKTFAIFCVVMLSFLGSSVWGQMDLKSQVSELKSRMEQKIQEDQTGRFIVQLSVPYQAERLLDPSAKEAQRKTLKMAQMEFLEKGLVGVKVAYSRALSYLPYVVVETDLKGLDALAASTQVVAVYEDKIEGMFLKDSGPLLGADVAWNAGYSGQGQTVAILDTGVQAGHSFLSGKVVKEACFSSTSPANSAVSLCPNGQDSQIGAGAAQPCSGIGGCDHGTHVAGIAAGKGPNFSGVARDATIIAVNIFSKFTSANICGAVTPCIRTFTSDQIEGLQHLVTLANANQEKVSSINMSIGGGKSASACDSDPRKLVVDQLRALNIATVIASGNDAFVDGISFPACISSAVSVGSTTKSDAVSGFSNSASFLTLLAPGGSIESAVFGGGFGFKSGTSMATPQVAGAWAVLKSKDPTLSVDAVLTWLETHGKPITDLRNNITKKRIDLKGIVDPEVGEDGKRCYAWANNPTASSYTPSTTYSYNSSGQGISITRSGTGSYSVRCDGIGGDGKAGGHVQVTAYGFDTHSCKVRYWSSYGKDFVANVACYAVNGGARDARFTIYVEGPMK
jgi:subtilisin